MKTFNSIVTAGLGWCAVLLASIPAVANVPGGGTNGANVTLTDNGTSVTLANGIMSIVCNKSGGQITTINYTFNNNGSAQTLNLLSGNPNGGKLYWENCNNEGLTFTYSVVADPAADGGAYAEISLVSTTVANVVMEVHYSLLRGSTGFYVTPIFTHRGSDGVFSMGECRDNIYAGSIFNWMSVDAARNRLMEVSGGVDVGKLGAPVEVWLWTNGIYAGQYEDKYKYGADFGVQRAWGWSSVGSGGKNIGLWNISASTEYYNGGPMKRELMEHIGTTILNMLNGGHYGSGGQDGVWAAGEVWSKVYGPYLIYCNNLTNTITATNQAAQALYADALAQAAAEQTAWPYYWFTNSNYATAANRGPVTGQLSINDVYNPNASASNLWVGLVQQPSSTTNAYDFQNWVKPYQFWAKTDSNGNFSVPEVIVGANYTLYAFGPGAAGTFQSQAQSGGNSPNTLDIPPTPFSITIAGGTTNNLETVIWTPTRVGPTVFEIGYPDRTAAKFKHGDDFWVGDIGPGPTNPLPVWSKWLEYPFDYPSGPNYIVGQSRWPTDWNFIQPVVTDSAGNYNGSTSTITFNLLSTPSNNASLYIALSSDFQGPLIVQVNGNNIAGGNGYFPNYSSSANQSDVTIREANHGIFSDARFSVPSTYLRQGQNTITLNMRKGGSFDNHAMYDYIRLELPGYVPPPPASVAAYAGNNSNLICWPVTPGATSYNVLRSLTSGNNFVSITNGVIGPVCGSGWNNAAFLDTNVVNGTSYYYVVQSANPVGGSTNSPQASATPSAAISPAPPAAPLGLAVSTAAHQSITLTWSASAGANFYTLYRSTLANNGGGASNILGTVVLANNLTNPTYTDNSPTDGSIYSYAVAATSAGGTSPNSMPVAAVPLPAPPASAPASLTGSYAVASSNVLLNWSAVSGAVGYIIRQATSPGGPFLYVENVTETTYTDSAVTPGTYYYQITPVNAAGVSASATVAVTAPPLAPASLTAVAGDSLILLTWSAVANATGYVLKRGTSSSNETTTVASNYSGTSYTNTSLANGTTYYYVVAATNTGGLSPNSPEASATPSANIVITARNLVWKGDGSGNVWDANGAANWLSNTTATAFNNGDAVTFDNTGSNNVSVALAGTLLPALTTFNAAKNYTFSGSGSIAGTNILIKTGTGTLTITTTNTYSGGSILSNGVVALSGPGVGAVTANNFGLGSGAIEFEGGTLQLYGYNLADNSSGFGSLTNNIVVYGGQTGTILPAPRYTFGSKVTGSGTLNLFVDYVRDDIAGDWSGFTGWLNVHNTSGTPPSSTSDDFRLATAAGFPFARVALATNVFMYSRAAAGSTIPIGEFSATTNTGVSAGSGSSLGTQNAVTWRVGGLNTDATNAAAFAGTVSFIKEGTGAWTLTGISSNTGAITVSNGTLVVNGSLSGAPVIVAGGALAGVGTIAGAPVMVGPGVTFAPGPVAGFGILTISNNLTLAGESTTLMQAQHSPLTNDALRVSGMLFASGTLIVTNGGALDLTNGDSFKLFIAPNFSGGFTNIILPTLTDGLLWNTNTLASAGTISVVALTSPAISNVQISGLNLVISGTSGINSWPYWVLTSTNLSAGQWNSIATNQFDAAGNFSLTLTNTVDPSQPRTFYKLQLQ